MKKNECSVQIYDIETFKDIFCIVFKHVKTKEYNVFEISSRKNDWELLKEFLSNNMTTVGFNNVNFDYPVLHKMLEFRDKLTSLIIHGFAQEVISSERSQIYKPKITQLDLFLIHHYNNSARMTSLKWLEFSLRWKKVQDLPFKHNARIEEEHFDDIIKYCKNDVDFTHEIFKQSKNKIKFRINMSNKLDHDVLNYSDVKIGEFINRVTYEKLSGRSFNDFKDLKTERDMIPIIDLIPDFVEFKTKPFQDFLEDIKKDQINANTKNDWDRHISIDNMEIKFAKGGLHSNDKSGITSCKPGYYLKEKDVGSMYPKAIIAGNYYPEHLGEAWNNGIELLYNTRVNELKPKLKLLDKKSKEYQIVNDEQEGLKLAMNGGGYGKTGSDFSWQKDKLVMFKVTFRGQLSLLMLLEEYYLLGGVDLLSANTDGIVIHYPKELDDKVQEIHDKWELMTDSILEDTFYKQIINRDVNNYIAEIIDGKTEKTLYFKFKGCFVIDDEWHKNNSERIVPIALKRYFVDGIDIIDTISNHLSNEDYGDIKNYGIYDFCIGRKAKGSHYWITTRDEPIKLTDKVIRYYIGNGSSKIFKESTGGKSEGILSAMNKGFNSSLFMDYEERDDYQINYSYYINKCNKIIKEIEKPKFNIEQLKLF